eukprot:TRINITY_DN5546_c0_g1_i4.p1 TRINITY_DN5546_c0_g1~~TRINITY_DN5546_c0_g1_i4.p1  ORF type:complete len:194 (-),score=69.45 TRINITY_DN5546_c0_g1_i4:166-747(-)
MINFKGQTSGPKNFKHESHVGLSADGTFDIRNIPVEWKRAFNEAGIKKSDLENPEFRAKVFGIMTEHDAATAPPPIDPVALSAPIPPPLSAASAAPAPPPPPPPPGPSAKKAQPPPVESGINKPQPPPPPAKKGVSLLDQIKTGVVLRESEKNAPPPKDLTTTLISAINAVRTAHADSDGEDDEEEWTTDDEE